MEELRQWLAERHAVYCLFAALLRGDLEAGVSILRQESLLRHFSESFECGSVREYAGQLRRELAEQPDKKTFLLVLRQEYNRLFVGPDRLVAPPWESVYGTQEKLLFGEPEAAVRRVYRRFGLALATAGEPADHFALELAFMARLCALAAAEADKVREMLTGQREFLVEHLLKWVPNWAGDVCQESPNGFWRNLAALIRGWLENDFNEIGVMIEMIGKE